MLSKICNNGMRVGRKWKSWLSYSSSVFVKPRHDLYICRPVKLLKLISPVALLFACLRCVHKHNWLKIPLNSDYSPLSFLWDLFTTSPDIVLTGCREIKPSSSFYFLIAHNLLPSPHCCHFCVDQFR